MPFILFLWGIFLLGIEIMVETVCYLEFYQRLCSQLLWDFLSIRTPSFEWHCLKHIEEAGVIFSFSRVGRIIISRYASTAVCVSSVLGIELKEQILVKNSMRIVLIDSSSSESTLFVTCFFILYWKLLRKHSFWCYRSCFYQRMTDLRLPKMIQTGWRRICPWVVLLGR